MKTLDDLLAAEIRAQGPIPFERYMRLALYHPELGYYEKPGRTLGRGGDFFTSVQTGSLFGELLAAQFIDWCRQVGPDQPVLIEGGAHDGQLALDILEAWERCIPQPNAPPQYTIVEPSHVRRAAQASRLQKYAAQVRWREAWDTIPPRSVDGVIFSNELLDSLPVHRIGWDAKERRWFEWGVGWENEAFCWKRLPLRAEPPGLDERLLAVLPDEFTTELCPVASEWWYQAATRLRRGCLLTLDYGLETEEFFLPHRAQGTLRGYRQHHLEAALLGHAGECDLTAHVDFTRLDAAGQRAGLLPAERMTQGTFLTNAAVRLGRTRELAQWSDQERRQFQTLTHPEHLGRAFSVLIQGTPGFKTSTPTPPTAD